MLLLGLITASSINWPNSHTSISSQASGILSQQFCSVTELDSIIIYFPFTVYNPCPFMTMVTSSYIRIPLD